MNREGILARVREIFSQRSAHEVSELFLSPHLDREFFLGATAEEGPSLWIVNRSDVYDETLASLVEHPVEGIRLRAKEKIAARRTTLTLLLPPDLEGPLEEVPDYAVEDVLGHPLVPFEAILYFTRHPIDDYRGSSALSLCRRLLEHPPNWAVDLGLKRRLQDEFSRMLVEDPSPFVRAYAARVPILEASILEQAYSREPHPLVGAKLLQNPATPAPLVISTLAERPLDTALLAEVAALDARATPEARRAFAARVPDAPEWELARLINEFFKR